jgi:putative transposase
MTKPKNHPGFKGPRFPPEIIQYAVWLYFRFSLSLRDVEDLLVQRGIIVGHETVRFWVAKFGRQYAKSIRRDRPQVGDKWHLDEVVIGIRGKKHWLWCSVDQHGSSLELLVQSRRNTKAAKCDLAPGLEHRNHKGLNNCAEVSHKPTLRRERSMGWFKSPRHAQQFLSAHDQINVLFRPRRHHLSAISYRHARSDAFAIWNNITCEIAAG